MKRITSLLTMLLIMSVLIGCQRGPKKPADFPDLVPCSLSFTQEGQPIAGLAVSLFQVTGHNAWTISGTTDATGTVLVMTHERFPGCPAGEYVITVQLTEFVPDAKSPSGHSVFTLVDKKYRDRAKSPLKLNVASEPIQQTFELGKKVRIKLK